MLTALLIVAALFVGAAIGMLVMALCTAAARGERTRCVINGTASNVHSYDRELTAEEIRARYARGRKVEP